MNGPSTVKVMISGIEFHFKTDDPDYIKALASYVDEQIQRIVLSGKVTSQTKAIAMAAFNIADELFRLKNEADEVSKSLSERLDAMLDMAEDAYRSAGAPDEPRES